jgi:hypothetical protein
VAGVTVNSFAGSENLVGGVPPYAANTIAFNGTGVKVGDGFVPDGIGILRNSIFGNDGLGIDLKGDGVTPDDAGDSDTGPNNLQNFPDLSSAVVSGTNTVIQGSINTEGNKTYSLRFYSSPQADGSGHGEGKTFLGQGDNVTTDPDGNATFTFVAPLPVHDGHAVSATATDPSGNTSEFSETVAAVNTAPTIIARRPVPGSKIRDRTPAIKATVRDDQTNISRGNISLFVDGNKKSNFTYDPSTDLLSYVVSGQLSFGRHTVKIVASDGVLTTTKTWRFRIIRQ